MGLGGRAFRRNACALALVGVSYACSRSGSAPPLTASAAGVVAEAPRSGSPSLAGSPALSSAGVEAPPAEPLAPDAGASTLDGDAGDPSPRSVWEKLLCDGAPGITFVAAQGTGGQEFPAKLMMAENGNRFLIVDGRCHYWVQLGRLEHLKTGVLSQAELRLLEENFRLSRWPEYTGAYPHAGAVFDAPDYFYILGRGKLQMTCEKSSDAGGCIQVGSAGNRTDRDVSWLSNALFSMSERLAVSGEPVRGDLRYLLVEGMHVLGNYQWSNPATWPLGDPDTVALTATDSDNYTRGMSLRATGKDADALREVWRQFLSYERSGREANMPAYASPGIPIQVSAKRYQLFIRDSTPFEGADGLIAY